MSSQSGSLKRATGVPLVAIVLILAACSSGTDEPEPAASTEPAAPARVTEFELGTAMCTADSGSVRATWTTSGATSVEISAGKGTVPGGPSGAELVPIDCSGEASDVTITPINADGRGEPVTKPIG